MMRSWSFVAVCGFVVACGGTVATPVDGDAGTDAAADAVSEAGGDGGSCVPSPVVGSPCKVGDVSCDVVDACCAPSYGCSPQSKTWQPMEAGCMCAGFKCGDKTCMGSQFCVSRGSGVDGGGTSYECAEYPTACARQWTCDCVKKNIGPSCLQNPPGICNDSAGHPMLSCMGQ
jgi:hypothetical protein